VLKSIQEEAGLGATPDIFTINASEAANSVIKFHVQYKKSHLNEFVDKLKEVIDLQHREVERAVIGRGKYRFKEKYASLEIEESK